MFVYAKKGADPAAIDVSRYGPAPFNRLSPFFYQLHSIPIAGTYGYGDFYDRSLMVEMEQLGSSVEGVWQGLKLLPQVDKALLFGKPKKRRGQPLGHDFGGYRCLDYSSAKALIYIPSYLWQLRSQQPVIEQLRALAQQRGSLSLVDVSYQPDCLGPKPISHACLLVDWLEGKLQGYEDAHQRLWELKQSLDVAYEEGQDGPIQGIILAACQEFEKPGQLESQPASYGSWAQLFYREYLLLTIMRTTGGCEWSALEPKLKEWVECGLLSQTQVEALGRLAPISRWW